MSKETVMWHRFELISHNFVVVMHFDFVIVVNDFFITTVLVFKRKVFGIRLNMTIIFHQ